MIEKRTIIIINRDQNIKTDNIGRDLNMIAIIKMKEKEIEINVNKERRKMKYKVGGINKETDKRKQEDNEGDKEKHHEKGSMTTKEKKEDKGQDKNNHNQIETYNAFPLNADHVPLNAGGNANNASNIYFLSFRRFRFDSPPKSDESDISDDPEKM